MFDRVNTMTGVISLGIGERDMSTPKLVCEELRQTFFKQGRARAKTGYVSLRGQDGSASAPETRESYSEAFL